ncbi:hypothetical protein VTJ04DRAFT_850 [Mycothermus thermophilus]|uniref:uncharacterized protein n=1 Tax=Humicola insolens TaxID=85995 RepID=UPI00374309F1
MIKRSRRSEFYTLLSRRMVLLDPTARATARECHDQVVELQERAFQRELYAGLAIGDDDDDIPLTDVEEVEDEDGWESENDSGAPTPRAARSVAEDVEAIEDEDEEEEEEEEEGGVSAPHHLAIHVLAFGMQELEDLLFRVPLSLTPRDAPDGRLQEQSTLT